MAIRPVDRRLRATEGSEGEATLTDPNGVTGYAAWDRNHSSAPPPKRGGTCRFRSHREADLVGAEQE